MWKVWGRSRDAIKRDYRSAGVSSGSQQQNSVWGEFLQSLISWLQSSDLRVYEEETR